MQTRKRYRKRPKFHVTAVQLDLDFDQFEYRQWGDNQVCKPGDWLVFNAGDTYTVEKKYFKSHYFPVSQGIYEKIGEVWAEVATKDGSITTIEGTTAYREGDYLVFDRQHGGKGYAIEKLKFERMYEAVNEELALTAEQQAYIDQRIKPKISEFKAKAAHNQKRYYLLQTIAIVAAALVPVFSGFITGDLATPLKWFVAFLGGASAVVAGLLSLFKYQEDWLKYQTAHQDLDSHLSQFHIGIGVYSDKPRAFSTLAENCENIMKAEVGQWVESNRQNIAQKDNSKE